MLYMCQIVHTSSLAKLAGYDGQPVFEVWGTNPRYSTYFAGDDQPVAVSLLETRIWKHFCQYIGRPDLISEDERPEHRHTSHGDRASLYREAIAAFCRSKPRDELCDEMEAHNIPICAMVASLIFSFSFMTMATGMSRSSSMSNASSSMNEPCSRQS